MGSFPLLFLLARLASAHPLVTSQRPPQQTIVQFEAQAKLVSSASAQSQSARDQVLHYLAEKVKRRLKGTPLMGLSSGDLLERLDWEFKRMPIIHNGPLDQSDPAQIKDDTDLEITMSNGYLQNVCQRWVLGAQNADQNSFVGEHSIMTRYMALPEFKTSPESPTLREANNCVMYLATNLRKTHCGNFIYGSITYVINNMHRDKFVLAPFDTGAYAASHEDQLVFGTMEDYYHVLLNHIHVLGYNIGALFKRWYLNEPPPDLGMFPYMEVEWMGNAWFPESILYVIVKYSNDGGTGLWGTDLGRRLQDSMRYRGRPVIWADGDDSGMLIDGTVNMIEGGRIGQEASDYFNARWDNAPSWQDFYSNSPDYLKFFLQQYEQRQICEQIEQNPGYMVMGYDQLGNCVYWAWFSFPTKWECLNDGTCEQSDSFRAVFSTQEECLQNCGQGQWYCWNDDPDARPGAHHCEPNVKGGCRDVDTCEAQCLSDQVCSSASTLGNASAAPWATQTYV